MIKEALAYLVSLKENQIYNICGENYSDHELVRIAPFTPRPRQIDVNGLDSIVKLVSNEFDSATRGTKQLFIRVCSPREVEVFTSLDLEMKRDNLYRAVCDAPQFKEGWNEYNSAIIKLRSMFVPNDGTQYLLDLLSRISKDDGVTTSDNGVTQQVEARSGVALKVKENVRPRVSLIPFRTFAEVPQPESEFLVRVDGDGKIGLFEADGGAWMLAAKAHIADYLTMNLSSLVESGDVVVMR